MPTRSHVLARQSERIAEEFAERHYMSQRCLRLWLTDAKDVLCEEIYTASHLTPNSRDSALKLFEPLGQVIHAQRMISSFLRLILPAIDSILAKCRPTKPPSFLHNSPERHEGEQIWSSPINLFNTRLLFEFDKMVCILAAEEFLFHCQNIMTHLKLQVTGGETSPLKRILKRFDKNYRFAMRRWKFVIKKHNLRVLEVRHFLRTSVTPSDSVSSCASLEKKFQRPVRRAKLSAKINVWRGRWKNTATSLGIGGRLLFRHTRKTAGLYELWCWYEIATAFRDSGKLDIWQKALLQGGGKPAAFSGHDSDIYFDYHLKQHTPPQQYGLLGRIRVEWFLKHLKGPANDKLFDMKYKGGTTADILKSLGYMLSFGTKTGVVIFRRGAKLGGITDSEFKDGFTICQTGESGEYKLYVMQLIPSKSEEKKNTEVLAKLVHAIT